MVVISLSMCTCPVSPDTIVCAKCGGMPPAPSKVLSKIDLEIRQWFYDLDSESRLNSSRKAKEHLASVSSRLQENNGKIAQILAKFSVDRRDIV